MTGPAPALPPGAAVSAPGTADIPDPAISRWTGGFLDSALEREFRETSLREWGRRIGTVAIVASVLMLGFGYVDYKASGPGLALTLMLGARLATVGVAIAMARSLRKPRTTAALDQTALVFMLTITALVVLMIHLQHKGVARETPAALLGVLGFYLFIPTRLPVQVFGALLLTSCFLAAQKVWGPPQPVEWISALTQFVLGNVLGAFTAWRNHVLLRREFLGARQARLFGAEEARHKRELQRSVEALSKSNAELEQFAYIASHDLQSPLRNVISFAQLLQRRFKEPLGPRGAEYVDTIVQSAAHMQELVTDLLTFSRVGRAETPFVPIDIGQILSQAEYQLAARLRELGAQVSHDPLPTIPGTAFELLQLMQNLLGNAVKFCAPGTQPRVHVSARPLEGYWEFSVRDNGIGIAPAYHERIFEMFERLHDAQTYEGTGIGLAICMKIVQRHGGRLWVESALGQGSTFRFTLPAGSSARID